MTDVHQTALTFNAGERLYPASDIRITDKDGRTHSTQEARSAGRGGCGVVYRALHKDALERAVKILDPEPGLVAKGGFESFRTNFEREISLLSQVTHANIAKIVDFGQDDIKGVCRQYYVMEFVEGERLGLWYRDVTSAAEFLGVFDQILDALAYLHLRFADHGIMHADLKSENILVQDVQGTPSPTLVDLGVAKRIPRQPELSDSPGSYFFSSPEIMRPERKGMLGKLLPNDTIASWFPDQDLYALGLLLARAMDYDGIVTAIRSECGDAAHEALLLIIARLTGNADNQYASATDVRQDMDKIARDYLAPMGVPELLAEASSVTTAQLPTSKCPVTERMNNLIDHRFVQRLHDIAQLNFVYFTYSGARHTRLTHSMRTLEITTEYVRYLLNDAVFRVMTASADIEAVLIYALLHDVGHYPLSHMFEDLAEQEERGRKQRSVFTDDELFGTFVGITTNVDEAVNAAFDGRAAAEGIDRLGEIIRSDFSPDTMAAIESMYALGHSNTELAPAMLKGILSSPIDADKAAYLELDSAATGVSYGRGADLPGLLVSLRAPKEEHVDLTRPVIAIQEKGLSAAESLVYSRYWMIERVYWHRDNRAVMAMVKFALSALSRVEAFDFGEYVADNLFATDLHAVDWLSTRFHEHAQRIERSVGRTPRNPLVHLVDARNTTYVEVLSVPYGAEREMYSAMEDQYKDDPFGMMDALHEAIVSDGAVSNDELRYGDILVDLPIKLRETEGGSLLIYSGEGAPSTFPSDSVGVSPLLDTNRVQFDRQVKRARVYISPELAEALEDDNRLARAQASLTQALRPRAGRR